jgi:hypothetical protein
MSTFQVKGITFHISYHAEQRAAERGITLADIRSTIARGKTTRSHNAKGLTFRYVRQNGPTAYDANHVVVGVAHGRAEVVTTFNRGCYDDRR